MQKIKKYIISTILLCFSKIKYCTKVVSVFIWNKKVLLFMCIFNAIVVGTNLIFWTQGKSFSWAIVISVIVSSIFSALAYYVEEIEIWINGQSRRFIKFVLTANDIFLYCTPVVSFWVSMQFAKMYYWERLLGLELVMVVILAIAQIFFVIRYCYELVDLKNMGRKSDFIKLFLTIIIHIIQLFANFFLLVLALNHDAFNNITAKSFSELCFDVTYFSAMTLLSGDGLIVPESNLVKIVVLIEKFIFTIFVSIIVLGFLYPKDNNEE